MGGVEVPQAPRGVGVGRSIPLPTGWKGLGRGLCPLGPPQKIFVFFVGSAVF